jgi:hypothetical protein
LSIDQQPFPTTAVNLNIKKHFVNVKSHPVVIRNTSAIGTRCAAFSSPGKNRPPNPPPGRFSKENISNTLQGSVLEFSRNPGITLSIGRKNAYLAPIFFQN